MIDNNYKVINDVLPKDDFIDVNNFLLSPKFPYYFNKSTDGKDNIEMFSHLIVNNFQITSEDYKFFSQKLLPLYKLVKDETNANTILRIKVNFYPKTIENKLMGVHTDFPNSEIEYLTCVYSLDSSNGFTGLFINNEEIKINSKANQLIMFDGKIKHYGSTATDMNRLIVNFDFIKGNKD